MKGNMLLVRYFCMSWFSFKNKLTFDTDWKQKFCLESPNETRWPSIVQMDMPHQFGSCLASCGMYFATSPSLIGRHWKEDAILVILGFEPVCRFVLKNPQLIVKWWQFLRVCLFHKLALCSYSYRIASLHNISLDLFSNCALCIFSQTILWHGLTANRALWIDENYIINNMSRNKLSDIVLWRNLSAIDYRFSPPQKCPEFASRTRATTELSSGCATFSKWSESQEQSS